MKNTKKIIGLLLCGVMISFAASVAMAAEEQVIQGTVEQTDSGVVIVADDAQYIVVGEDLSAMVGKTVAVTGTVEDTQEGKTIKVMAVKEIK